MGGRWGREDDHVSSLRLAKAIGQLIGEQKLAVVEVGKHGAAVDLMGLSNEEVDEDGDGGSGDEKFDDVEKAKEDFLH